MLEMASSTSRLGLGLLALILAATACTAFPAEPEHVGTTADELILNGLFATGVNNQSQAIANTATDPHYSLSSTDPLAPGPIAQAIAAPTGWLANVTTTPGSKWISGLSNAAGASNATYTYATTFTIPPEPDPATASMTGKWACNDTCLIKLNGVAVPGAVNTGPNAWVAAADFTIPAGSAFKTGTNTLEFVVTNVSGTTGLHVTQLSGSFTNCTADSHCPVGDWCHNPTNACRPKIANGGSIPFASGHVPTLNTLCTPDAAVAVCVSGVCDTADNLCGIADNHASCTLATGPTVCRSTVCSANGKCMALGGCNIDADCVAGTWCNESTHKCLNKFANGTMIPSDPPHTNPVLDGICSPAAAELVCQSKVCDVADNRCGYADSAGPCNPGNAAIVCRSGACSVNLLCTPAGGCNVDEDCSGGAWCVESSHSCTTKIPNGGDMPSDTPHTNPVLNGLCSAAAATLVCVSGVCDIKDNKCGYAYGDGPCSLANGAAVCRQGGCSPNASVCIPAGGCAADADCTPDQWCDETIFTCVPKLTNGEAVPSSPGHIPPLDGMCTPSVGASVCLSGVCDTADNLCGYANGDGPCTSVNPNVCRSEACSLSGVCMPAGGCNVDGDCSVQQWCLVEQHTCKAKLDNGSPLPIDPDHTSPVLDGQCTAAAGALACKSGVCDVDDNLCGYPLGHGPCNAGNGATVCRSTICATTGPQQGTCVACASDANCSASTPACNVDKGMCLECSASNDTHCAGATPVCDPSISGCVPCNGDLGSSSKNACKHQNAPYCFMSGPLAGQCGNCSSDADCQGHPTGPVCDTVTGACKVACHTDADCSTLQWCNAVPGSIGSCVSKLDNGSSLPLMPPGLATCTAAVGKRVCASGVCDTKDNKCGLVNGNGSCTDSSVCRSDACDPNDGLCGFATGDGPCANSAMCRVGACDLTLQVCSPATVCAVDADCASSEFCSSGGVCASKRPVGEVCDRAAQCQSDACYAEKCDALTGTGSGLCAMQEGSAKTAHGTVEVFGLLAGLLGVARRRRR